MVWKPYVAKHSIKKYRKTVNNSRLFFSGIFCIKIHLPAIFYIITQVKRKVYYCAR